MKRTALLIGSGYLMTFIVATLSALTMNPIVSPLFGNYMRSNTEGLNFLPLLAGYFIITLGLVWLVPRVATGRSGWVHGAIVGTMLGSAVFLGDHLVTAGWSKIPTLPMFISGIVDILAVIAGGIIISLLHSGKKH